ncbi:hypothetical protein BT96DRAFT_1003195 [Gymnopus androsaceus JB14]|uniref:Uncharacterized protein n=1 Tax=Gymnopus androsaceus JB14 TaxID=1447944 RepID=A0A6A4GWM5_9AGAR|nr:hypothetical protein BT96DRAFT_1003195 [Gymnopus androsaceus JB14]
MVVVVLSRKPGPKHLLSLTVPGIDYSFVILKSHDLKGCNFAILSYLKAAAPDAFDNTISDDIVVQIHSVLFANTSIPGSNLTPQTDLDLNALWIIDLPQTWLSYPSIPRRTSIVMSFRIFCNEIFAGKNIVFFLANRCRDMFSDGLDNIVIAALSFVIDNNVCIGFVAFRKIKNNWYPSVRTTPWYVPTPGSSDSFFATWPLLDNELGSDHNVKETLRVSRQLAQV